MALPHASTIILLCLALPTTCILSVQSNPSPIQRTRTTVLPSQPRQSSAQGTTRIIDHTKEPSSSHEFLSTLTPLQYTKSTIRSSQSGSQRSLRSSSSPSFSQPSISSASEMVPLKTSSSLIPSPPRNTEKVEIQATLSTEMQEQTDSTTIKTSSSATPTSPLVVNESKTRSSASSSSSSRPTAMVRTSMSMTKAQQRPTSSQLTASSSTLMVTKVVQSSTVVPSEKTSTASISAASSLLLSTTRTPDKTIKALAQGKMIFIALAASLLGMVIIITVVAVASIWRRALRSKRGRANLDPIKDCSDPTEEKFSTFAIHLNNEYGRTIPMAQTSLCTELEDSALAYPSSFLPLTDTSPASQVYEEVGRNLQEDTDADAYTFPNARGKDTEGYVVKVSNVKDDVNAYGYTVPNVTFHNVIQTTSIDIKDENDYLVPNVRCCKGRTMSSTLGKYTHTLDDQEGEGGEGYIVPTANRTTIIDDKDEDDYLVPNFRLWKDKRMMSTSDEGGRTETNADHQKKTKIVPTSHEVDENDYLVPNRRLCRSKTIR